MDEPSHRSSKRSSRKGADGPANTQDFEEYVKGRMVDVADQLYKFGETPGSDARHLIRVELTDLRRWYIAN